MQLKSKFSLALIFIVFFNTTSSSFGQVNVITKKTTIGNISESLSFTGETKPIVDTYAAADISGPIQKLLVEDGMQVKANQPLAIIEKVRFEIALKQSNSSLKVANQLKKEKTTDFARNKTLYDKAAITQKVFDAIETALISAESNFELEKAKNDRAKLDLERCEIRAPIDGFFVNRSIELGQAVQRGQNIGQVINLQSIYVDAKISDTDINKIKIGQSCLIEEKYIGIIRHINLYADNSRSFKVRIRVPNSNVYFKANMFTKGKITIKTYKDIPLFPSKAIRTENEQYYVYLNVNGKAKRQQISIIAQDGEYTYAKGVSEDSELIIVGQDQLSDNSLISIRNSKKRTSK